VPRHRPWVLHNLCRAILDARWPLPPPEHPAPSGNPSVEKPPLSGGAPTWFKPRTHEGSNVLLSRREVSEGCRRGDLKPPGGPNPSKFRALRLSGASDGWRALGATPSVDNGSMVRTRASHRGTSPSSRMGPGPGARLWERASSGPSSSHEDMRSSPALRKVRRAGRRVDPDSFRLRRSNTTVIHGALIDPSTRNPPDMARARSKFERLLAHQEPCG
jgi:hypothetical protein